MKGKVVKIFINVLSFKNKEGFNIDGIDKTYNYVFVNSLFIKNSDKLCTWSTVTLKQLCQDQEHVMGSITIISPMS